MDEQRPTTKELIDFVERSIVCKPLEDWQRISLGNWLEYVREGTVRSRMTVRKEDLFTVQPDPIAEYQQGVRDALKMRRDYKEE